MLISYLFKSNIYHKLSSRYLHRSCYSHNVINNDELDKIRNIGISAHIDSGKTTLTERILFYTGKISEMHEVKGKDKVGATMDFMELERQRGITIQSAATFAKWKDHNINIIDTPGHVDFTIEVERSLRVLDGAVLVLCAVGGVQSQTLTVNRQINRYKVPFVAFINKLDRGNADPFRAVEQMRNKLKHNAALIQIPMGLESEFEGIIDLIDETAIYYDGPRGNEIRIESIPNKYLAKFKEYQNLLIERLSSSDEKICSYYLNERSPPKEELIKAIKQCTIKRSFTPVTIGSALKNKGVQTLLDYVNKFLPCPHEVDNFAFDPNTPDEKIVLNKQRNDNDNLVALAFKLESGRHGQLTYIRIYQGKLSKGTTIINSRTGKSVKIPRLVRMHAEHMEDINVAQSGDICAIFGVDCYSGDTFVSDSKNLLKMEHIYVPDPVISLSIEPKNTNDLNSFSKAISRFSKEDPTFRISVDTETKETIMSGMGELHLEIYAERIKTEYNCPVNVGKPKVSFRETLTATETFDYLHKKQTGGAGQYAKIIGRVEALPADSCTLLQFEDKTVGTNVPKNFIPAINKGFIEACERGFISNHRASGLKFVLTDGGHHIVDSSELAFRLATIGAMKEVFSRGNVAILEPCMNIEISLPIEYQGSVLSSIVKRLGEIKSNDIMDDLCVISAIVPLNSMFGFSSELRIQTQGKGEYTMEYSHYNKASIELQNQMINKNTQSKSNKK